MTVGELKEKLATLPDDVIIVEQTDGFYSVTREQDFFVGIPRTFCPQKFYDNSIHPCEEALRGKTIVFIC